MTDLVVLNLAKREMQAVSLDGSRVRTLVGNLDETPDGVVADAERGHIYWTNMGTPDPGASPGTEPSFFTRNGSIERVDFDGGNRRTIVPRGTFTTGKQLTADFADGKLYWCDREGMQVLRCDLDGSNVETLIVTGIGDEAARDARNHPVGVAVDPIRRMIYWSQKGAPNAGQGRIFRAPIDVPPGRTAANRNDVELLWADLPEPIDLHLDADGMLVWTDRGNPPDGNTLNRAQVQPDIRRREICSRGYQEAIGLATADGVTYYVGDLAGGHIRAVNVSDGTEHEVATLGPGLTGLTLADLKPAAQVGGAPSARRKRRNRGILGKIWLPLVVLAVITVVSYGVNTVRNLNAAITDPPEANAIPATVVQINPKNVTYEVFGTLGGSGRVTYADLNSAPVEVQLTSLPWTYSETTMAASASLSLVAQVEGDSVGCRILVDGQVRDEHSVTHEGAAVACTVTAA
jgi:hypothetical protein